MTLYDFNALDELEQAEAIWDSGVLLADRTNGECKYILYQIDSFYVELRYHIPLNIIKGARVFANPDHLEPYLDQIAISL